VAFKKIICPVDFSGPSVNALKVANEVAAGFGAELVILHVVPAIPRISQASEEEFKVPVYQAELESVNKNWLEDMIKEKVPENISVRPTVTSGDAAEEILSQAGAEGADLIVISKGGKKGGDSSILGSVTYRVVRAAQIPVLSVSVPKGVE